MTRFSLLACAWLTASAAASAAPLRLLLDERSVVSAGSATTVVSRTYFDGTSPTTTVEAAVEPRQPIVYRADNRSRLFDVADGMALRTASATLDGQGAQTSRFTTTGLSFSGVADVFASAEHGVTQGDGYIEETTGIAGGSAESSVRWRFALDAAQPMLLTMTSSLDADHLSGFSFQLTGDNGFAWTTPYLATDDGPLFTFTRLLKLKPGVYTLDAQLRAGVNGVQAAMRGDRATAAFSLLATRDGRTLGLTTEAVSVSVPLAATVPEPAALQLALVGLTLLAAARRRLMPCRTPRPAGRAPPARTRCRA